MFIATLGIVACGGGGGGGGSKNPVSAGGSEDKSDMSGESGGGLSVSNNKLCGIWSNSVNSIERCGNKFYNTKYIFYSNGKVSLYSTAREETYGNTLCLQVDGNYKYNESKNTISLSGMKSKVWFLNGDTLETKNYNETEYKIVSCNSSNLIISCVPDGRNEEKTFNLNKSKDLVNGSDLESKITGLWSWGTNEFVYFTSDNTYSLLKQELETSEGKLVKRIRTTNSSYSLNNEILNFENKKYVVTEIDDKTLNAETLFDNKISFKKTDSQPITVSKEKLYGAWKLESKESEEGVDLVLAPNGYFKWNGDDYNDSGFGTFDIKNNIIICENKSNLRTLNWFPVAVDDDSMTLYTSLEKTRYVKIKGVDIVAFAGGKGTASEPYLIETAEQLDSIRYYTDKCFKQTKDIDVGAYLSKRSDSNKYPSWMSNGREGWIPIDFSGNFDGNYKKIKGFYSLNTEKGGGLFGSITHKSNLYNTASDIKNVLLYYDSKGIKSNHYVVGGLINSAYDTNIENCYVNGNIIGGTSAGGIVGYGLLNVKICNCCYVGSLQANNYVGGIASSISGSIKNCFTSGNFKSDTVCGIYYCEYIGGDDIDRCYSTASMEGGNIYGIANNMNKVSDSVVILPKLTGENIYSIAYRYITNSYYCIAAGVELQPSLDESECRSVTRNTLWGASTKNSFWKSSEFLNWTDFDENWEFRSGYNLPQLKNLPSVKDPSL